MKTTIKKVNPKAGTLKLMNDAVWNNVSRKLIAFILMLGLTLTAFVQEDDSLGKGTNHQGGATATTINRADTCCLTDKGKTAVSGRKAVKLVLPSVEMVRKADSESFMNLFTSASEQNTYMEPWMVNLADVEIKSNFDSEVNYKVSIPATFQLHNADETVNASFVVENIGIGKVASTMIQTADDEMNAGFVAENERIITQKQSVALAADREINNNFEADNGYRISVPSQKSFASADQEISKNINKDRNSNRIVKTTKKGHK